MRGLAGADNTGDRGARLNRYESTMRASVYSEWDFPRTETLRLYEPDEGGQMEFRLIYQGPLRPERDERIPGASGRAKDKHKLRKHFHRQLRELWTQHPGLSALAKSWFKPEPEDSQVYPGGASMTPMSPGSPGAKTYVDILADLNIRCNGNRFVPLVREAAGFTCALDILFLRRDNPGHLIKSGGDIDNRIKVLLDGLRMPKDVSELGGHSEA